MVGKIDDIHFINQHSKDGLAVSNHLKWLANELPITFIYAGVGLKKRRFFQEGLSGPSAAMAQSGRRWTRFEVGDFKNGGEWQTLVKAIEKRLVLTRVRTGSLVGLSDYLFDRTGGHIGSLMTLVIRGAYQAIRTGTEALPERLLATIRIDEAAERGRRRPDNGPSPETDTSS